jgi:KipI family sensor histidine kinase inhibitor
MPAPKARFLPAGDTALVIEFGDTIDRRISARVLDLAGRLEAFPIEGIIETVPTFRSLMVHYDPNLIDDHGLRAGLQPLLEGLSDTFTPGRHLKIPVCYTDGLGPDLAEVAAMTGLQQDDVIACHARQIYYVYAVGFLPGFPYMGDLPAALVLPRRVSPRLKVPPGSVAIAMGMTGIYPQESPGGWHLIGSTPVPIFDRTRLPQPALLMPGDSVEFEPISRERYREIIADPSGGARS